VVLVEDDPRLLSILADALGDHSDIEVLSCHGSAEEALAIADWERCTILLADLNLPGLGGVALILRAKASRPGLIAAAYTVNDQQQEVLAAIRAGASGYILKREPRPACGGYRRARSWRRSDNPFRSFDDSGRLEK
jgi:DNA-binding NarL/FixJ family response regulator